MTHKTEVSLMIPNLEDLFCINCKINVLDIQNPIIKNLFHYQILICRLIIYSVRCCIASPSIQNEGNLIHVIISKKFYSTGKLQEYLSNLKIQFTNPEPVHLKIYEACLKYMFTFKLAPLWNLVGTSFYLHGFNFLSLPCNIDAVKWKILFKDNQTRLEVKPLKINLFPFNLECLSLASSLLDDSIKNSSRTINSFNLSLFQSIWVYVLPKLTKARIISVSKTLPGNCPFENYNDLRRYWKNMYSYRLPKNDEGMLFYEVIFPRNLNQQYIYPEVCVLFKIPEFLMCENTNKIASEFIKDLSINVHSICGDVIKIGNLFPKLNIEYSCILNRKNNNHEEQNECQSKGHFFKTSTNYIIKPANEKMNLSSLLTFRRLDKMSASMKIHSQKVFSIMENKKFKKTSMTGTKTQYILKILNGKEQKSNIKENYNKKFVENQSILDKKTDIINIDDICSYYDLPSMYSNYQASAFRKEIENLYPLNRKCSSTADYLNSTYSNHLSIKKPIIKNVENVCFDLTDIKIRNAYEFNYAPLKLEHNLNSEQLNKPNNAQNLFNSTTTWTSFSALNSNSVCKNIQSTMSSSSILENEKSNYSNTFKLEYNQVESHDQIRLLLSRFDLYNMHQQNDDNIETIFYNKNNTTYQSVSLKSAKKLSQNLETNYFYQNFLDLTETSQKRTEFQELEVPKFDENVSEHNFNTNDNLCSSLQCSPFLLNKSKKKKNRYLQENLPNLSNSNFRCNKYSKDQIHLYKLGSSKSMINVKAGALYLNKCEFNNINFNERELYILNHLQSSLSHLNSSYKLQYKHQKNKYEFHYQNNKTICTSEPSFFKIHSKDQLKKTNIQKSEYKCIDKNLNKNNFYKNKVLINKTQSLSQIEGLINKKLLKTSKSSITVFTSNNELKIKKQKPKLYESIKSIFNSEEKNVYKEKYSFSLFDIYKKKLLHKTSKFKQDFQEHILNSNVKYQTQSSIPMFTSNNRLENIYASSNKSQHSPSILFTHYISEIPDINISQKNKFNTFYLNTKQKSNELNLNLELKHDKDSISILSQSSNESNSGNYESYKLACTEALTFD